MWKTALQVVCIVFAWLLVSASFVPLVPSSQWWIRLWDFPRLQVAILSAVVLVALLFVWRPRAVFHWITLLALVAALLYESYRIFPYTPIATPQIASASSAEASDDASTFSLLIINVLMGNRDAAPLLEVIAAHDPDIVLAVETDAWWAEQLEPVGEDRPHSVILPLENEYGMVLYSRHPLHDIEVRELSREDVPSIRARVELPGGRSFVFFGMHPPPPVPGLSNTSTPRDAELVMIAREIEPLDGAVVVAGDLNDVAWSHTSRLFQRISTLRDPRVGRGMYNSFHADYFFARWPLDHVFLSEDFRLIDLQRLPKVGSDHFPMFAKAALIGTDEPATSEPAPADAGDREEAEETLEEHAESPDNGG